jgi:hypothetical protein
MNGDALLKLFLDFIQKEKPHRFGYGSYADLHGSPCNFVIAKEACYGAYDAVMFLRFGDKTHDVIPIEVKGDTDVLDERLRSQIYHAINNFGKSLLLVDAEKAYKIKKLNLHKMLPCEIWAYNGVTFQQLSSEFWKHKGDITISQRAIEKAFGIHDAKVLRKMQRKIVSLSSLIWKLTANQWRYGKEEKFSQEESEIAALLLNETMLPIVIEQKTKPIPKDEPKEPSKNIVQQKLIEEKQ